MILFIIAYSMVKIKFGDCNSLDIILTLFGDKHSNIHQANLWSDFERRDLLNFDFRRFWRGIIYSEASWLRRELKKCRNMDYSVCLSLQSIIWRTQLTSTTEEEWTIVSQSNSEWVPFASPYIYFAAAAPQTGNSFPETPKSLACSNKDLLPSPHKKPLKPTVK